MTRILIADDNKEMLQSLRWTLGERPEWNICGEASDGLEAVSKAKDLNPDLVILDLTMPKLNGLQAASAIKAAVPKILLLLFTQHMFESGLQDAARKAGFNGGVTKGFHDLLIAGVEALIRGETFFPDPHSSQLKSRDAE
jgi:DNA-binding NarL/FixJ family response regulator